MLRRPTCVIASFIAAVAFSASHAFAQTPPSEAQIKRDLMNPGVIAIIVRGKGAFEKFVTDGAVVNEYYRSVTVRRKTDKPGVTLDVIGDVVYRRVGGRWVYRTMRLAGNQYSGIKNPTIADINQALSAMELRDFPGSNDVIEYESVKLADAPNWEWHTPNSVSFHVVAVYRAINFGRRYSNVNSSPPHREGFRSIDRVREIWRVRIYREREESPWANGNLSRVGTLEIPDGKGGKIPRDYLLDRKEHAEQEIERMPRASKVPSITE